MLTVYRASAGSGKTHKLTGEYLKLLFSDPVAYRRVLAVTFTNKATDEMKSRIVQELYHLASGKESGYVELLSVTHSLTEDQVRVKARSLLVSILHDYSAFNISTIDRFFQQTMRAFTREIGLQGGYGIEMDHELVLAEAVDRLLADLEKSENKELLGWLLRFAEDKIENGGEWNLRRDIMSLGREVFKESYKAFSEEVTKDIEDKDILEQYREELYMIIRPVENRAKHLGERGLSLLEQFGLKPVDFKGGSRSPLLLLERLAKGEMKEPTATFIGLADNVEGCYAKTTDPAICRIIGCVFEEGLNDCIKDIVLLFENLTHYNTAKEIVRYYYTLGILTDISHQITAYREDKNVMLIADTTELLSKVIDGSDAPFIYEKTGTAIDHYMIDEFQDTSAMQWNNFRSLMCESLAHQFSNLIVGDVKQSIYRFRNSDWELLDKQLAMDFSPEQMTEETLNENWRSYKNIIEFNNVLFTTAPVLLQGMYNEVLESSSLTLEERSGFYSKIVSAYNKSYQKVAPPFQAKDGHVKIEFIAEEDTDWKEEALNRLPAILERLQDNGYALKDIAVLVRTNKEGALVADKLLTYKDEHPSGNYHYDIISDDSLFVNSSVVVRFMIALLRYLQNPEDQTNKQMARFSYLTLCGDLENVPASDFPPQIKEELVLLSRKSIYEITEGIYRIFSVYFPENEQIFVQAFLDLVLEYSQRENADLTRFLKWWDETGCRKAIATPDAQNAIRILTVHKSKGLGFKVVLIPFGDWEIDHKPTKPVVLWCHPEESPFNRLHLVPVRYGQILSNTIFAKDYFDEKLHAYIDNLNTLYVALTRAKEELIIFSPRPKKLNEKGEVGKITSIADLLWGGISVHLEEITKGASLLSSFDTESGVFELGDWWNPGIKTEKAATMEEISIERLSSISPNERLQLRLQGKEFSFDNPLLKYGTLMHDILSKIQTKDDVTPSVDTYRQDGVINETEAIDLKRKLFELVNKPEVSGWFDGSKRVLNEIEILIGKGESRRPDRVMITGQEAIVVDYKFGEQPNKRYRNQVKNYLSLVQQIGYPEVSGYLWYVELGIIEPVFL